MLDQGCDVVAPGRGEPPTSGQVLARWGDDLEFAIDTFGPAKA